jgi:hypothetical protein
VDVYRAVAKITVSTAGNGTAPFNPNSYPIEWTATIDGGTNPVTLTYKPVHWYVFQSAHTSYVAPNYDIKSWVTGTGTAPGPGDRPKTFAPGERQTVAGGLYNEYDHLTTYMDDGMTTKKRVWNTFTGENVSTQATVADGTGNSKYVGENAPDITRYGTGTFVFFSTQVTVNAAAEWVGNTSSGEVKWIAADYGSGKATDDIYYIRYNGNVWVTDAQIKVDNMLRRFAEKDWRVVIGTDPDPAVDDGYTYMTAAEFQAARGFETFIYQDGYVHFQWFVDNMNQDNAHDVLRNQFIHMSITGVSQTANKDIILGYPGQTTGKNYPGPVAAPGGATSPISGNPDTPIDPTQSDNNPYQRDPNEPVDPTQTAIAVSVQINPWTYVTEGVVIQ